MFRALLTHPQEALNKRHLVYCVRVMSVGCTTPILVQETDIRARNIPSALVEITSTMHLFIPLLYSRYWFLHVSAAVHHH
jgi:hypothetical protein